MNAQVIAPNDSSYQVGSSDTASITVLDPPSDNSIAVINVRRSSAQSSVAKGETIICTFTRSGGDTTQPLTVDIEVSDPGDFQRGDFWDAPPVMPTQVQFGAGSIIQTLELTVPDDRRDLLLEGVTVAVLPSTDYLLYGYGENDETSSTSYVNDNDIAQKLNLDFGMDGANVVDDGDSLKFFVKRRQQDANNGQHASFIVRGETDRRRPDQALESRETYSATSRLYRDFPLELTGSDTKVEHERGWESSRHADWPIDSATGKHYQEFPLMLTGNQRKINGRIKIPNNGLKDPSKWIYKVSIKRIEDINGIPFDQRQLDLPPCCLIGGGNRNSRPCSLLQPRLICPSRSVLVPVLREERIPAS